MAAYFIMAVFGLLLASYIGSPAISGPPPSGNWVVTGTESHYNEVIVLNGNLIVEGGGNLTLRRVTLEVNCTYSEQFNITVMPGGSFYVLEGSVITSTDPGRRIGFFFIRGDSTFKMNNSELHNCGTRAADPDLIHSGLRIVDSSNAIIENSLLSHNMFGIVILSDGDVVVRNNNVTANDDKGIHVHHGSPIIRDNYVSFNRIGIGAGEANPTICNNTITSNYEHGISAHGGSPTIYNNTIRLNLAGVRASMDCNAVIQGNNISSNLGLGISLWNKTNAIIRGNTIAFNGQFGIMGDSNCSPIIQGNNITANDHVGIHLGRHCTGLIEGNSITSNADVGIYCFNNSLPKIHWNDIYNNAGGVEPSGVENNDPSVTINATYNYWGNGPSTSPYVLYDPWLTESILHIEITNPLPGEIVSSPVTISTKTIFHSGTHKVEFYIDHRLEYTDNDTPYEWSWNTTNYAETEHRVTAKAYDILGLKISKSITVFVDNTPPIVIINAPTNGTYVKGIIKANVTGSDVNLNTTELYINGVLKQSWAGSGTHIYTWNTSAVTDGLYALKLRVYDDAGHWKAAETTAIVDNTPPTAEIRDPAENTYVRDRCKIDVYGHDTNLDVVELYLNGSLAISWAVADDTYIYSWNTTADGPCGITLLVRDKAGSKGSDAIMVIVDNTPPTVSFKEPVLEDVCYGTLSLIANATDNNELDSVQVKVGDGEWSVMTYNSSNLLWKYSLDTTRLSDGQYTMMALALDQASNPAIASIDILIDNTPPTLTIRNPQSGATAGLTLRVEVQASDVSGISRIEFYLQDVLVYTITDQPYQWPWDTTKHPNGEYTITVKAYDMIGRVHTSEATVAVQNVESPWWQTHFWTITEVVVGIGGLILGVVAYITAKERKKKKK